MTAEATDAEIDAFERHLYQRHGELALLLVERTATAHEVAELINIRHILEGADAAELGWPSLHYRRKTLS
jgi:hypothetical protein